MEDALGHRNEGGTLPKLRSAGKQVKKGGTASARDRRKPCPSGRFWGLRRSRAGKDAGGPRGGGAVQRSCDGKPRRSSRSAGDRSERPSRFSATGARAQGARGASRRVGRWRRTTRSHQRRCDRPAACPRCRDLQTTPFPAARRPAVGTPPASGTGLQPNRRFAPPEPFPLARTFTPTRAVESGLSKIHSRVPPNVKSMDATPLALYGSL